jgi:hypothetical protein
MRDKQALIIEDASADKSFVTRWIDAYDEIETILHRIYLAIFGDNFKLHVRIRQGKTRAHSTQCNMREHEWRTHA